MWVINCCDVFRWEVLQELVITLNRPTTARVAARPLPTLEPHWLPVPLIKFRSLTRRSVPYQLWKESTWLTARKSQPCLPSPSPLMVALSLWRVKITCWLCLRWVKLSVWVASWALMFLHQPDHCGSLVMFSLVVSTQSLIWATIVLGLLMWRAQPMVNTLVFHATTCPITLMTTECGEEQGSAFHWCLNAAVSETLLLLFISQSLFGNTLVHWTILCYILDVTVQKVEFCCWKCKMA